MKAESIMAEFIDGFFIFNMMAIFDGKHIDSFWIFEYVINT